MASFTPTQATPETMATPGSLTPSAPAEAVRLRRAESADAAALALVGAATFLEAFTWMLPGADIVQHCARHHTAEGYASYLAKPTSRITLAEVVPGGAPVGYAMLTQPELQSFEVEPGDTELKRIYLLSRFRSAATPVLADPLEGTVPKKTGQRAGQALLDAAFAEAEAMGCTRMLLGTHAGNLPAIAFYRRNGFREAGTRTFQVGSQVCSDLIFARVL